MGGGKAPLSSDLGRFLGSIDALRNEDCQLVNNFPLAGIVDLKLLQLPEVLSDLRLFRVPSVQETFVPGNNVTALVVLQFQQVSFGFVELPANFPGVTHLGGRLLHFHGEIVGESGRQDH